MAREKGKLIFCLDKLAHHVGPHKAIMFLSGPGDHVEIMEYRNKIVRDGIAAVERQIQKIQKVAEEKGYKEIMDILNEELEYGHDI